MEFLTTNIFSAHQCVTSVYTTHVSFSNIEILFEATKQIVNLLLNSCKTYAEPNVIIALPGNQTFCFSLVFWVLQFSFPFCYSIETNWIVQAKPQGGEEVEIKTLLMHPSSPCSPVKESLKCKRRDFYLIQCLVFLYSITHGHIVQELWETKQNQNGRL